MYSTPQSHAVELDDYRWLLGPEAADRLREIQKTACDLGAKCSVRLVDRLRRELSAPRAHLILQQVELRQKAREKFPDAQRMFFTPRGLEQATDHWIAAYKAARFPRGERVADWCCGIGGDLSALAARGPVRGVDRDSVMAIFARANADMAGDARAADNCQIEVVTADVADVSLAANSRSEIAAWHIDPDRRPAGRRTTQVAFHEPSPQVIARLLAECPHAAIKLAPAAAFAEPFWNEAELEWISRGRQCRQLVAWFGRLAEHPGQRRATVIGSRADNMPVVIATFVGQPNVACLVASQIGRYVFEPDAAVLAAKLEGALATEQGLSAIAPGVAYFTADHCADHGALACFEVLEVMPYRTKPLRQWLAARGIGRLEVKKRGVPLDPDAVRGQLQCDGNNEATILLARLNSHVSAIIARRKVS